MLSSSPGITRRSLTPPTNSSHKEEPKAPKEKLHPSTPPSTTTVNANLYFSLVSHYHSPSPQSQESETVKEKKNTPPQNTNKDTEQPSTSFFSTCKNFVSSSIKLATDSFDYARALPGKLVSYPITLLKCTSELPGQAYNAFLVKISQQVASMTSPIPKQIAASENSPSQVKKE